MNNDGTRLQSYMRPFPEPEAVFAGNIERHQRHFFPLMSIDASAIDSTWKGPLHIVSAKETYDGAVGEHCPEFHTDLCWHDTVAFSVDSEGRYTFLADFRFFIVERGPKPGSTAYVDSQNFIDEVAEHYKRTQASFDETKAHYHKTGFLNPNSAKQPNRKDEWLQTRPSANLTPPLEPKGRALPFVARARGWSYYKHGPDAVSLHFDPTDRIAVVRFFCT